MNEISGKVWSLVVVLDEVREEGGEMVALGEPQLPFGHIGTQRTEVKVVGEGVHVQQYLDVIYFVQE